MLAEAVFCAALVVYGEARGESYVGREAVAHVVVNRARLNKTTVCWETFKPDQFAGVQGRRFVPKGRAWEDAVTVAQRVVEGEAADFTGGATHFDNLRDFGRPCWASAKDVVGKWGNHTFFRARPGVRYNERVCSKKTRGHQLTKGESHAQVTLKPK